MFDDNKKSNQKQNIESNRQCISEKKKDRKTHYTESLILRITVFTLIFSDHFPHASDINSLLVRTILY